MRTKAILLPFSMFLATMGHAQQGTSEELTRTKSGTDMVVKGSSFGMYGGTESETAMAYYEQALEQHRNGDLAAAKKTYAKVLKEDPKFVEAYDNLGQVHRQDGEYDLAIKNYKRSLELYPEGQMARQNLAVVYSIRGENELAKKEYEAIVKYQPESPEGYFGLANSLMLLKQYDPALENAKKALEIYEESGSSHTGDGHYMVGLIQYYRDEMELARTHLQRAKELGVKIHPQIEKEALGAQAATTGKLETPEDYEAAVPQVVGAFEWLLVTPLNSEPEKRKELSAFLIRWITGSPTVSVEVKEQIVPYMDQPECFMIYLGGYTKFVLQSKDDKAEANLYATLRVLEFYEANRSSIGKHKELEKLLKMRNDNKLKGYIKSNS